MKRCLRFSSHPENLASVRAFVRQFLGPIGMPEQESELLILGVDEACSNIIRHAYRHVAEQPITLSCEQSQHSIRFCLRDFGQAADHRSIEGRPLDQVKPGGLGMHLIRHAFDEVDFHPKEPGTELVLVKRLTPRP